MYDFLIEVQFLYSTLLVSAEQQSKSATCIQISPLRHCRALSVVPLLYCRFLLVICFIYVSVNVNPNLPSHPTSLPLVSVLFVLYVCVSVSGMDLETVIQSEVRQRKTNIYLYKYVECIPCGSAGKESACDAGDEGDAGSTPG